MGKMTTIFREYKAGEVIFRQGDPGISAFIIESGRVSININKNGEEIPLTVLGEGEIFGEMAIIDRLPRSATAVALDQCRLTIVSQEVLVERIQAADPVVRLLLSMFIRRTREMHKNLVKTVPQPTASAPQSNQPAQTSAGADTGKPSLSLVRPDKEALDEVRFASEINLAFSKKEFRLNYQPIVNLQTAKVAGYEALIRWHSPSLGVIQPGGFMSVIEESAIMIPVGRWILQQAMTDLVQLRKAGGPDLFMSVNVSPRQFLDPIFVQHLESVRQSCGLEPKAIKLEFTEQMFIQATAVVGIIERCRNLGYRISLDDFGTGYSSISYLRDINMDELKIDQTFVRSILVDPRAKSITGAMISLAKALSLNCIAEGIESGAVAAELVLLGCSLGQGFHFGKPQGLEYYLKDKAAA
jgi:diguanylate cyclase